MRPLRRHLGTLALLVAVALAIQLWQTRHVAGGPLPAAALDAPLSLLAPGAPPRPSTLREEIAALQRAHPGQAIGLYIWADWCPVCRTLQGTVDGVAREHPLLTVAMQSGPPDQVARYQAARGLAWRTLVDPHAQIPSALGFGGVPAFVVITPQGALRWPTLGLTSGWGLRLRLWLAR